ncbi:MAG: hypothetical protein IPK82_10430 [Polyangiaceae bacterium]|nr:hypothetical protein [Polyangiaceae bacterium]
MPWIQGASSVLSETADQLRKLLGEVKKGVQVDMVDAHVERTLVEGRHVQKRTALGQPRLVATLSSPGLKPRLPVYLPDTLAKDLPAIRRFPVRLIGELRPRADQGETSPAAVRAIALGRVVG